MENFKQTKGGSMIKVVMRDVVFNNEPDPVTSIKEYKIDDNGKMVLVKEASKDELKEINNKGEKTV
jgi:hypothetical protein